MEMLFVPKNTYLAMSSIIFVVTTGCGVIGKEKTTGI
jgi:hypothetical protein